MKLYFLAAVMCMATVTAALESDSHGNWSNEKLLLDLDYGHKRGNSQVKEDAKKTNAGEPNEKREEPLVENDKFEKIGRKNEDDYGKNETQANLQQKFSQQVVQPYLLQKELEPVQQENVLNEPTNGVARPIRKSQSASHDAVTVEYLPSKEVIVHGQGTVSKYTPAENNTNNLDFIISADQIDVGIGNFGQRVRHSPLDRHRNENFIRVKSPPLSIEDYRKEYTKNFRSSGLKKLNASENTNNPSLEDQFASRLSKSSPSLESQKKIEKESSTDFVDIKAIKGVWKSNDNASEVDSRGNKPRRTNSEQDSVIGVRDIPSTTTTSLTVSLGKFSGPIVVPDLPRQKKYPYSTVSHQDFINAVPRSTSAPLDASTKAKASDSSYLASPIVLNPLQVGVALMNAGHDMNTVNDQDFLKTFSKEFLEDDSQSSGDSNGPIIHDANSSQSDTNFQSDQVPQPEQIAEVASNLPSQSVEIQKSVEIFHTAPIQEIHYPVEFIPSTQQSWMKQRPSTGEEYRNSKDKRPGQVNIYKSNEIVDDVSSGNQERGNYEFSVYENDVAHSATNGQVDQTIPLFNKQVFGAKEQLDTQYDPATNTQYDQTVNTQSIVDHNQAVNTQYEQTIKPQHVHAVNTQYEQTINPQYDQAVKYLDSTRFSVNSDTFDAKQSDYDLLKGPPTLSAQFTRLAETIPNIANPDSLQGTREVLQIPLTKASNDPPPDLKLLLTVPQLYPLEKVIEKTAHMPHSVDFVEKKIPYPIEKVIEKQTTIPQPYPVHVPIDRVVEKQVRIPYPVHVEKVIEKKVPYPIQRVIIPFPIHFRVPQPVPIPVEKVVEKPVPIPVPIEKAVLVSRPFLKDTKLKSGTVPVYNVQNEGNFQKIRQQNFQTTSGSYGSTDNQAYFNGTQFYGLGYALSRSVGRQPVHQLPKKFGAYGVQFTHPVATYSALVGNNGNSVTYGKTPAEDKAKNEYLGLLPRKVQGPLGPQSKALQYAALEVQSLRRTRQEGMIGTGSFRQSKMEYGFKPPMVPSVQYDEQSASKVE